MFYMNKEIFSTEKALHRILFNSPIDTSTIRSLRHRWKNKALGIYGMERLLIENGYTKIETAKWVKNE